MQLAVLFNDDVDADDVIMTMCNTCTSFDHDFIDALRMCVPEPVVSFFIAMILLAKCTQCDAPKRCNNFDICIERNLIEQFSLSGFLNLIEGISCEQDQQYP